MSELKKLLLSQLEKYDIEHLSFYAGLEEGEPEGEFKTFEKGDSLHVSLILKKKVTE